MALTRIIGTAVRHPVATTGTVLGVAKGTLGVVRRLAHGENPLTSPAQPTEAPVDEESSTSPTTTTTTSSGPTGPRAVAEESPAEREPEVVLLDPANRDLPEPIVIVAEDEPEPTPDLEDHIEVEEELVWTSESSGPPASE